MRFVIVAVALLMAATAPRAEEPIVLVVVIDGLGGTDATPDRLPRLAVRAAAPSATWTMARGVLPARTNPNHASILTGYWPDGHGVVGNRFWDAAASRRVAADDPALLDAETLFDVLAAERPAAHTAAFLAKSKLRGLFAGASGAGSGPRAMWDPGTEYASDGVVLRAARAALADGPVPALLVVSIADVDRACHQGGPRSPGALAAVERADRLLDELLDALADRGLWDRAVVVVTADHGFASVPADGIVELPAGTTDGVAWIDEGLVALGHPARPGGQVVVPASLRERPGVAGVRTDLGSIGLDHPRAGAVLLVAAAGHAFTLDARAYRMRGDHGGEDERPVPFIVVGGHPGLRRLSADLHPELPDVAPTLAAVLGVRDPHTRRDGDRRRGRRLPIWAP